MAKRDEVCEFLRRSHSPLVIAACSPRASELCSRNGLTFVNMLRPFMDLRGSAAVTTRSIDDESITLKDLGIRLFDVSEIVQPSKDQATTELATLIRRHGDLIGVDQTRAPPSASTEIKAILENDRSWNDRERRAELADEFVGAPRIRHAPDVARFAPENFHASPWFLEYRKEFHHTLRSSEWEFVHQPAACLIVLSSSEEKLLSRFQELFHPQRLPNPFQHGFMDPHIFRYHVLLHDMVNGPSLDGVEETFRTMKSTFGSAGSALLKINSVVPGSVWESPSQPDIWTPSLPLSKRKDWSPPRRRQPPSVLRSGTSNTPAIVAPSTPVTGAGPSSAATQTTTAAAAAAAGPGPDHGPRGSSALLSDSDPLANDDSDGSDRDVTPSSRSKPAGVSVPATDPLSAGDGNSDADGASVSMDSSSTSTRDITPMSDRTDDSGHLTDPLSGGGHHDEPLGQDGSGSRVEGSGAGSDPVEKLGQCLSGDDLLRISAFVAEFVQKGLVPHMERKVRMLNDLVSASRRGLKNQLKSWWTSKPAAQSPQRVPGSGSATYPHTSMESHIRQLADFAFMLQDYDLAQQSYNLVAGDFKRDKALRHYAGAQEMVGLCNMLQVLSSQTDINGLAARMNVRDAEQSLDAACVTYQQAGSTRHATRATMYLADVLMLTNRKRDASAALLRAVPNEVDLHAALLLEQAAHCFLSMRPSAYRKFAFHMILAGHRYSQAGQRLHALRCYGSALGVYEGMNWGMIEDHIAFTIGRQAAQVGAIRESCVFLLRALALSQQTEQRQQAYLREFLHNYQLYMQDYVRPSLLIAPSATGPFAVPDLGLLKIPGTSVELHVGADDAQYAASGGTTPRTPKLNRTGSQLAGGLPGGHDIDHDEEDAWQDMEAELESLANKRHVCLGSHIRGSRTGKRARATSYSRRAHHEHRPHHRQHDRVSVMGEKVTISFEVYNPLAITIPMNGMTLRVVSSRPEASQPSTSTSAPTLKVEAGKNGFDSTLESTSDSEADAAVPSNGSDKPPKVVAGGTVEPVAGGVAGVMTEPVDVVVGAKAYTSIRLSFTPQVEGTVQVLGVKYLFCGIVNSSIDFDLPRKRLNRVNAERVSKVYGENRLLHLRVVGSSLAMQVHLHNLPRAVLQGELRRAVLELSNTGSAALDRIVVKISHPSCFCIGRASEMDRDFPMPLSSQPPAMNETPQSWQTFPAEEDALDSGLVMLFGDESLAQSSTASGGMGHLGDAPVYLDSTGPERACQRCRDGALLYRATHSVDSVRSGLGLGSWIGSSSLVDETIAENFNLNANLRHMHLYHHRRIYHGEERDDGGHGSGFGAGRFSAAALPLHAPDDVDAEGAETTDKETEVVVHRGQLLPGHSVLLPLWMRGRISGFHRFRFVFRYEGRGKRTAEAAGSELEARTFRLAHDLHILPSSRIQASLTAAVGRPDEHVLALNVHNVCDNRAMRLLQVTSSSSMWQLDRLAGVIQSDATSASEEAVPTRLADLESASCMSPVLRARESVRLYFRVRALAQPETASVDSDGDKWADIALSDKTQAAEKAVKAAPLPGRTATKLRRHFTFWKDRSSAARALGTPMTCQVSPIIDFLARERHMHEAEVATHILSVFVRHQSQWQRNVRRSLSQSKGTSNTEHDDMAVAVAQMTRGSTRSGRIPSNISDSAHGGKTTGPQTGANVAMLFGPGGALASQLPLSDDDIKPTNTDVDHATAVQRLAATQQAAKDAVAQAVLRSAVSLQAQQLDLIVTWEVGSVGSGLPGKRSGQMDASQAIPVPSLADATPDPVARRNVSFQQADRTPDRATSVFGSAIGVHIIPGLRLQSPCAPVEVPAVRGATSAAVVHRAPSVVGGALGRAGSGGPSSGAPLVSPTTALGALGPPSPLRVTMAAAERVRHDFGTGPCIIPVDLWIRNATPATPLVIVADALSSGHGDQSSAASPSGVVAMVGPQHKDGSAPVSVSASATGSASVVTGRPSHLSWLHVSSLRDPEDLHGDLAALVCAPAHPGSPPVVRRAVRTDGPRRTANDRSAPPYHVIGTSRRNVGLLHAGEERHLSFQLCIPRPGIVNANRLTVLAYLPPGLFHTPPDTVRVGRTGGPPPGTPIQYPVARAVPSCSISVLHEPTSVPQHLASQSEPKALRPKNEHSGTTAAIKTISRSVLSSDDPLSNGVVQPQSVEAASEPGAHSTPPKEKPLTAAANDYAVPSVVEETEGGSMASHDVDLSASQVAPQPPSLEGHSESDLNGPAPAEDPVDSAHAGSEDGPVADSIDTPDHDAPEAIKAESDEAEESSEEADLPSPDHPLG